MAELVEYEKRDENLIVKVNGDIDAYHSGDFKKSVKEKIKEESFKVMIIDLENVPYIDSAGLGTLVSILRDTRTEGKELRLSGLRQNIKRIFEMTRLDKVFQIYETLEEALMG